MEILISRMSQQTNHLNLCTAFAIPFDVGVACSSWGIDAAVFATRATFFIGRILWVGTVTLELWPFRIKLCWLRWCFMLASWPISLSNIESEWLKP